MNEYDTVWVGGTQIEIPGDIAAHEKMLSLMLNYIGH